MPMYEYECTACGTFFEELVSGSPDRARCPECRSKALKRLISAPSDSDHVKTLLRGLRDQAQASCETPRFS